MCVSVCGWACDIEFDKIDILAVAARFWVVCICVVVDRKNVQTNIKSRGRHRRHRQRSISFLLNVYLSTIFMTVSLAILCACNVS